MSRQPADQPTRPRRAAHKLGVYEAALIRTIAELQELTQQEGKLIMRIAHLRRVINALSEQVANEGRAKKENAHE